MTAINALSTRGVIQSTEDGFSSAGEAQPGADSAAMMFAAIFNGWLNQSGQGQDSGQQSNEPAGKEANSGRHALMGLDGLQGLMGMLQGNEGTSSDQLKVLLTQLDDLRSQSTQSNPLGIFEEVQLSGMTGQPQGKSTPQSELDLYKNVISNLLKEMSGEMSLESHSPKELNALAQQKSEIAAQRYNSGLFIAMAEEGQIPDVAPGPRQQTPSELLLLNQKMVQSDRTTEVNQGGTLVDGEANQNVMLAALSGKTKLNSDQSGRDENLAKTTIDGVNSDAGSLGIRDLNQESAEKSLLLQQEAAKASSLHSRSGDQPAEGDLFTSKDMAAKELRDNDGLNEITKADKSSSQDFGLEGTGLNQVKDISHVQGKGSEKTDLPIWNQVARDIFDKAYQARPHLREMTIRLNPAELGQINISMTWEEGQVHLRMVASETGTGQMLQSNFAELRDNLSQLGIQCGMMEMGLGEQKESSQEHQGRGNYGHSQENGDEGSEPAHSEELARMILNEDPHQGANRINVRA